MIDAKAWAQLVRIPNTFTSCADVLAGMCVVGGVTNSFVQHPVAAFVASLASIGMYWAGMALNDVFDVEVDREQGRPGPLVNGRIAVSSARRAGFGMLVAGVLLTALATWLIAPTNPVALRSALFPVCLAVLLALAILAYDGPMKKSPLAPGIMGLCRGLNMAIGMAIVSSGLSIELGPEAIAIVIGHSLYVTGLTVAARREADRQQSRSRLLLGWGVCGLGAAVLAVAPSWDLDRWQRLDSQWVFPGLILVLLLPLARRAVDAIVTLDPKRLGMAIKQSIVTILFLDAALALQFSGDVPGLILCSLVIPTLLLGRAFRAT